MRVSLLIIPLLLFAQSASGGGDQALLCDQAAHRAARVSGVPLDILLAITRVETGRDTGEGLSPWPWAINLQGSGSWFDTVDQALVHLEVALDSGTENIDIGCFQLNYRWHRSAFPSLDAMINPIENAQYAAEYLLTLYHSLGTWEGAIGAYHSRTDDLAQRYAARVSTLLGGGLTEQKLPDLAFNLGDDPGVPARENTFPLLKPGIAGQGGSIVPQTGSRGALFATKG